MVERKNYNRVFSYMPISEITIHFKEISRLNKQIENYLTALLQWVTIFYFKCTEAKRLLRMNNFKDLVEFESKTHEALNHHWGAILEHNPLTTFTYLQFFDNGTFTNLCSDQEWSKKYYTMDKIDEHFLQQIKKALTNNKYHVYFWPQGPSNGEITSWLHDHGIGTGFTVFKREGNKVHGWGFTSETENHELVNFYLNNQESLLKFGRQFATDYNQYAAHQKNVPYANMGANLSIDADRTEIVKPEEFIAPTRNKISLFIDDVSHDITIGQWEVMELIAKGRSMKQIAYILKISPKTVEQRLGNLRSQLEIYSRDQIFETWIKNSTVSG